MKRSRNSPEENGFDGRAKAQRPSSGSSSPTADAKRLVEICTNDEIDLGDRAQYLYAHPSSTWARNDADKVKIYSQIFEVDTVNGYAAYSSIPSYIVRLSLLGVKDNDIAKFLSDIPAEVLLQERPQNIVYVLENNPRTLSVYFETPGVVRKILENVGRGNINLPHDIAELFLRNHMALQTFLANAPPGTADRLLSRSVPLIVRAAQNISYMVAKTLLEHGVNALPGAFTPSTSMPFPPTELNEKDFIKLKALLRAAEEKELFTPGHPERTDEYFERETRRQSAEAKADKARRMAGLSESEQRRVSAEMKAEARRRSAEAKRQREAEAAEAAAAEAARKAYFQRAQKAREESRGRSSKADAKADERRAQKAAQKAGPPPADCPSWGQKPRSGPGAPSFIKQSLIFHPDKNRGCEEKATKKFKKLQELWGRV